MKAKTALWSFLGFAAGCALLAAYASEPPERRADLPLGGFLKPGEHVALIDRKEPPGTVLRVANAKDLELIEKVRAGDEDIEFVDQKTLSEELKRQAKDNPVAAVFEQFKMFDAAEINGFVRLALKQIKICSVVSVQPGYIVLKFDEMPDKEVLLPLQQIARIERPSSILDER